MDFFDKAKAAAQAKMEEAKKAARESMEAGMLSKVSQAMDKIEGGGSVSTPAKDGKLMLDSLSRDELLVVAKRTKEMTNRLKGEAQGAAALERSGRAVESSCPQ